MELSRILTERKHAEDALREAERKYRDIFENAGEGIFQSTPDGQYIAANPTLARMYGFASPAEVIRSRLDISRQLYVDPTRREEFKCLLEEQDAVRGFEHQVFRKDGSKIWISVNARVVRDEQGVIHYYEGTAQDITDRKRAEEALRESEERYRELFENARDAIYDCVTPPTRSRWPGPMVRLVSALIFGSKSTNLPEPVRISLLATLERLEVAA